jgi:glycine cleavage system H protein
MSKKYEVKDNLYYSREHEWARIEGDRVVVGITDYAQQMLHEVVYVEVNRKVGDTVSQTEGIGSVESVKAISDIYSPISGKILEINKEVIGSPEILNKDPYGEGWILILAPTKLKEDIKKLMDHKAYIEYLEGLEE